MAHLTMPTDLPKPEDDGVCKHLQGTQMPSVSLSTTAGSSVDVSAVPGLTILFCYPRTGAPGEVVPDSWNAIPGARGCTPQACSFRDNLPQLKSLGVEHLYGLSTQSTEYQQEVHNRLHLPYHLLSDEALKLRNALDLPTFDWEGKAVIRRLTLAIEAGKIVECLYPVFPSDNITPVIEWLKSR